MTPILNIVLLLLFDALFLAVICGLVWSLTRSRPAFRAVLRRNFNAYFSNPTGYVFLCLFVLLSSVAAFWTHEFFAENLANFNQLSRWFPYIMLVFIPAITMSIWADERRQGTDELLLTIPASDWDIVLGKFGAALAVFTVSLLFSQVSNFVVLNLLAMGDVDVGLVATNYLGYWFMGATMLAIGMVASFLTNNLTVGFVLGVLFNIPLVFLGMVDAIIPDRTIAMVLSHWGIGAKFEGFGRGVVGLSATSFFVMVIGIGLYLSSVLIGRRHWAAGKDGESLLGHYILRTIALIVTVIAGSKFFENNDKRVDATMAQVSSLSPDTLRIVKELDQIQRPVTIEAFISNSVPEDYVQTKVDLTNLLAEFRGHKNVTVRVHNDLEPYSDMAVRAEEQFGIKPETVVTRERGSLKEEQLFLGAAFTSGLEKVVVPFFDRGIPVEYELIRSIRTAAHQDRKRLGVVKTDAELFGGFDMQFFQQRPKQLIVQELEKQYDVVEVDPANKIDESLDVLLVVQPSSLPQNQLDHLVDAVRAGVPAAIFEDPLPAMMRTAPGTGQPRRPKGGGMMGMGAQPPEPKGDITQLWNVLGVEMSGKTGLNGVEPEVVWQDFDPYKKLGGLSEITPEWVFASPQATGADNAINEQEKITAGMQQILFLFTGALKEKGSKEGFTFTPLVSTGTQSGYIAPEDLDPRGQDQSAAILGIKRSRGATGKRYTLAAKISGPIRPDADTSTDKKPGESESSDKPSDGKAKDGESKEGEAVKTEDAAGKKTRDKINAIFVCDIDVLASEFLRVRQRPDPEFNWQFENVTFVLNVVDALAGDPDFLAIRTRQTRHSTLTRVDKATQGARDDSQTAVREFGDEFEKAQQEVKDQIEERFKQLETQAGELQTKLQAEPSNGELRGQMQQLQIDMAIAKKLAEERLTSRVKELTQERDRKLKTIERDLDRRISKVQNSYKLWAAFLPVIPPLLVGLIVYARRASLEKEGVSRERLR
ncbi:MAG: Gldg family protein [Planctomycetota bacterium]|nr:Gldg family protein [Planctomycetota bacterium]MDA1178971.1 Gldg family protein [Planctomycetota bacterium]